MKKLIVRISFILIALSTLQVSAQWLADVRLTNNPANSFSTQDRGIAAYGNNIHVVWQDHRDGDAEVYYKRSTDNGVSWSSDLRLSPLVNFSGIPTIALYQSTIHIFWVDQRIAPLDIFYVRSTDNGATWQPEVMITTDLMNSTFPSLSVSGNNVYLAWEDDRHAPKREIYFKRSTNSGVNWSSEVRLTNDTVASADVSIASFGQNIHLAWESGTGNSEIYYKNSTNGGITWSTDLRMTNDPSVSYQPSIAVSGQNINLVWADSRDGNREIYFKRSTDGGANWSSDARLTNAANNSLSPNAIAFGQQVGVVWADSRLNSYKIYYKVTTNGGLNWSADLLLSPVSNAGSATNPSIDISDSSAHVTWEDNRDGNSEIYYKKNIFSLPVGITPVNSEMPAEFSISQNYPNPFNPATTIEFDIPSAFGGGNIAASLIVYDLMGREVKTLINQNLQPGKYSISFDGGSLASGVYFYRIIAQGEGQSFIKTMKMLLVK